MSGATPIKIRNLEASRLASYVQEQIRRLIPFCDESDFALIDRHLPEALARLDHCIAAVRIWTPGAFDVLQSAQYCTFLYYLANTIWRRERAENLCTKLFLLNKQLNAIEIFYDIALPDIFLIGHSVGIVLAKADYGNHLVLFQNSTVGRHGDDRPVIEDGVILYPNTAVIGRSLIRQGSIVSQGVRVIDRETEARKIAFQGTGNSLIFKEDRNNTLALYFRDV
ncbi:serine O-acetyltransferase [Blastomonas natatoria]|uniref:Serine O-acetyltransferase n=1 Tax=Blastomonas natatoria TaxID=34015 RepID=A0A2V3VA29_9SPHN|nr:hypothetical protein [Blastomonas natatoria]PXW77711.1 serine O-acetyltransferase [Blastomonas natatoria]